MIHTAVARGEALRRAIATSKHFPKEVDWDYRRPTPLEAGWLLPCLLEADSITHQRWDHWTRIMEAGGLIDDPIPPISWDRGERVMKMLDRSLNSITRGGGWQGWSSWRHLNYFLDWILFGLGHTKEAPKDEEGASDRLYQAFCLEALLAYPYDYFGDIMAENAFGRQNGFFPTPMHVVELMVRMQMDGEDMRSETVMDCCMGTGRMLLCAASASYRLYGQDIDQTVIKAALVNGYLYAPWLVKPFGFWDNEPVVTETEREEPAAVPAVAVKTVRPAKAGQMELFEL
jgi:hypothetical protein